jgi:hypothetical protein
VWRYSRSSCSPCHLASGAPIDVGIAYTDAGRGLCCGSGKGYRDFEGRPAVELLTCLDDPVSLPRSMVLALVNALNHFPIGNFSEGSADDGSGIGQGSRVAMVGFFKPLMNTFRKRRLPRMPGGHGRCGRC